MNRRSFLAAASGALAAPLSAAPAARAIIELRYMRMRNTAENQVQRTTDFLRSAVPALKRSGIGPLGFFASVIGEESPFILAMATFPSLSGLWKYSAGWGLPGGRLARWVFCASLLAGAYVLLGKTS
ncbi:MAG: hypothetical protein LAP38_22645, partial [Acidobacteriia bacterium]|nr:hypothetical protein [Terriglobia bacterium]